MELYGTRNLNDSLSSIYAIVKGLSNDGGLYFPLLKDLENKVLDFDELKGLSYKKIALKILNIFFDEFSAEELEECINSAYCPNNFKNCSDTIAPLTEIGNDYLLELYNGPTSAFKDIALTILPYLLTKSYTKCNLNKKIHILTATSGDTGMAALSGFKNVANTSITVFYPTSGVSQIQKAQMQTAEGDNVDVVAVNGNFDDCQKLVKTIYADENIKNLCDTKNIVLSSANSINIGRLIPQVVYYISSYIYLLNQNVIKVGDSVNFSVPTGNFGDILAGYIAKMLGLPIDKLICASNDNNVLTEFINTGVYDKNRTFYKTISPSMDILVSSNLERLLFILSKNDDKLVSKYMSELNMVGKYVVSDDILSQIKKDFFADYLSEVECKESIKKAFEKDNRLIDPHTAVAYGVLDKFKKKSNSSACANIILSTASPYKFPRAVLNAIKGKDSSEDANVDDFAVLEELYEFTRVPIPTNLKMLKNKKIRFTTTLNYDECYDYLVEKLGRI